MTTNQQPSQAPSQTRTARILFAMLGVPSSPTNGHDLRNAMLLRALAAEGHDVTTLSFENYARAKTPATLHTHRFLTAASPRPFGVHRFRSPAFTAAIADHLRQSSFDVLLCDDIYLAANIPFPSSVPVLLNKHDLTYEIMQRYVPFAPDPLTRAYVRLEAWKLRRWARRTCHRHAGVLACSSRDRAKLLELCPAAKIAVVPNVIDVLDHARHDAHDADTCSAVFVGAMDWPPNQDAVAFFVSTVLPALRRRCPDITFTIVGRNPSDTLLRQFAALPGVAFTGTVPDVKPYVSKATVCVVPLRFGSGTRLKILEAAALEKPIVSTRLGAEGLDFRDGEEILLADDPPAFADAVAMLLENPALRRRLGVAARQRVETAYGLTALQHSIRAAFDELLWRNDAASGARTCP